MQMPDRVVELIYKHMQNRIDETPKNKLYIMVNLKRQDKTDKGTIYTGRKFLGY